MYVYIYIRGVPGAPGRRRGEGRELAEAPINNDR